jgi:hypothetical protein
LARQCASDAAVARDSFAAALPAAWKAVLVEPMRERLAREEAGYLEDLETFRVAAVSEAVRSAFADRDEAYCPVCEQPTEENARRHIHAAFDHGEGTEDLIARIQGSFERAKILRRSLDETARASIKAAEDTYRLALTRLSDAKDDLRELEDRLLDSSQDDLRSLARQASELGAQLAKARETLSEQQQELKDRQTSAEALRDQIRKAAQRRPGDQAASEVIVSPTFSATPPRPTESPSKSPFRPRPPTSSPGCARRHRSGNSRSTTRSACKSSTPTAVLSRCARPGTNTSSRSPRLERCRHHPR